MDIKHPESLTVWEYKQPQYYKMKIINRLRQKPFPRVVHHGPLIRTLGGWSRYFKWLETKASKISRNAVCPCGSEIKYKKCCLK